MKDVPGPCWLSPHGRSYLRAEFTSCHVKSLRLVAFRSRWTRRTDSGVKASTVPSPVRRRCQSSPCPASCSFCPSSSTWAASFTRNKRNASSYTVSNQLNSSIVTQRDLVFEGLGGLFLCCVWVWCLPVFRCLQSKSASCRSIDVLLF